MLLYFKIQHLDALFRCCSHIEIQWLNLAWDSAIVRIFEINIQQISSSQTMERILDVRQTRLGNLVPWQVPGLHFLYNKNCDVLAETAFA